MRLNLTDKHHEVYNAIDPESTLRGSIAGRQILIVGAGRGIGEEISVALARGGAATLVLASRSLDQLQLVKGRIESLGLSPSPEVLAFTVDNTSKDSVASLFAQVKEAGVAADCLVANAGYFGAVSSVHESDPDDWCE